MVITAPSVQDVVAAFLNNPLPPILGMPTYVSIWAMHKALTANAASI